MAIVRRVCRSWAALLLARAVGAGEDGAKAAPSVPPPVQLTAQAGSQADDGPAEHQVAPAGGQRQ